MNILHLDSSILGPKSVSRTLSADIAAKLAAANPGAKVTYRDLAADPVPHLSGPYISVARFKAEGERDEALTRELAEGEATIEQFLAADVAVIGVALYNFTIPSQLKAWIDRICMAGKTFRYPEGGGLPIGLCGDKRVILAMARGGVYGPGSPVAAHEHCETYLRSVFGFLGVTKLEVIAADGLNVSPEFRQAGLSAANRQIAEFSPLP